MRNILLVIWCCITFFNADIFAKSQDKINQVIYLSNGKMYCCDISKKSTDQLPINSDTVENFSLSPTKRYLAYEKVIKYVDLYYEIDSEDEFQIVFLTVGTINKDVNKYLESLHDDLEDPQLNPNDFLKNIKENSFPKHFFKGFLLALDSPDL